MSLFLLNAAAAGAVFVGWLPSSFASAVESPDADTENDAEFRPDRDALILLGRQMAARAEELDRREAELDELYRSKEVQRRLGELAEAQQSEETEAGAGAAAEAEPVDEHFERLSRAYENMEPESAASALTELDGIDRAAVVQLLGTWKPRTSGAILDALAQSNPEIAAALTYEIWKRDGKNAPPPATADR